MRNKLLLIAGLVSLVVFTTVPLHAKKQGVNRLLENNTGVTVVANPETVKAAQDAINKLVKDATTIKSTVGVTVPLIFAFENENDWKSIEAGIASADNTVTIVLQTQGVGGVVYLMNEFVNEIKNAQDRGVVINMDVMGPAASAHAFMTCYANNVHIREGASLLFHEPYAEGSALNGLVTWRDTMSDPANTTLEDSFYTQCIKAGRLTKQDVIDIKAGSDVIIANQGGKLMHIVSHDAMDYLNVINQLMWILAAAAAALVILGLAKRV